MQLEENNRLAEKYRAESEALRKELAEQKEKFYDQKEAELEKARREAQQIVNRVQRESQALIDELDKLRKEKENPNFTQKAIDARHKQKSTMNKLYSEANPVSESKRNEGICAAKTLKRATTCLSLTQTVKKGYHYDTKGIHRA